MNFQWMKISVIVLFIFYCCVLFLQNEMVSSVISNVYFTYGKQWLRLPQEKYAFHPSCPRHRIGPSLAHLEKTFDPTLVESALYTQEPWTPIKGLYVGNSTCDRYTSSLGSGQKVLSFAYYTPFNPSTIKFQPNGEPIEYSDRYHELMQSAASSISDLYPGWRMRIYHNVTHEETTVWQKLCDIYCNNSHVDLCDTRDLPSIGNLYEKFPYGRFWRFQVVGDPTVSIFGSRDVDSYVLPRERAAVAQWEASSHQWHIMRDAPRQTAIINAGLWGGKNYVNFSRAAQVRSGLLNVTPKKHRSYDQEVLRGKVWPLIRENVTIQDSYNCQKEGMGHMLPWPTKRKGTLWVGFGPARPKKNIDILIRTPCPVQCRPEGGKEWSHC